MSAVKSNPPGIAERDPAPSGDRPLSADRAQQATRGPANAVVEQRRRPSLWAGVWALLRKELLLEVRTMESVPGMALFAVSAFVVFHFALNRSSVDGDLAAGILFVTLLFASLLGINRLFAADADQGGFDGFLLAPVDGSAMLLGKALALLTYLVVLEIIAVPAFAVLLLGPSPWPALPGLVVVLLLADLGVAAIGTLVSALAVRTRARDLFGPLLALPLLIPVVIGASNAISPLVSIHAPSLTSWIAGSSARWLAILAVYDLLFWLLAYAVFDFLLED